MGILLLDYGNYFGRAHEEICFKQYTAEPKWFAIQFCATSIINFKIVVIKCINE